MTTSIRNCNVSYVNNIKTCKCKGSGFTAPVNRNVVTSRSAVCKFKPRLLYSRKKNPVPTAQAAERAPDRLCTFRMAAQSLVPTENRTVYYKVHNLVTTLPELFTKDLCCTSSVADCQIWGLMNNVADWLAVKQHSCMSHKTRDANNLFFLRTTFPFFYRVFGLKSLPTVTEGP